MRPFRTDFFRYLAEVFQSKRRKNILSLLLLIALVGGFFDTLGVPLLSSISFVSACAMIAYFGYILLTFVPTGWKQRPDYSFMGVWLVALGIGAPLAVFAIQVFTWLRGQVR